MKYKNRVLQVLGPLNMGGQETLVMNIYRKINKNNIQFDFAIVSHEEGVYEDEVKKLGATVYHVGTSKNNKIKYAKKMYKLFKNYNTIHIHNNSAKVIFLVLIAKLAKCKKIIIHSHNTSCSGILKHKIARIFLKSFSIIRLACGEEAGKWMYKNKKFIVIPNGIDVEKYKFNEEIKIKKKQELKINKKYVIGHIGRFVTEKNHERLIDIFSEILKSRNDIQLLLIGKGELKEKLIEKIRKNNILENVTILENRSDINELMNVMDVFVFPSIYEGLPVSLIEAQANGLKIVASSAVTKEVDVTENISFIDLEKSNKEWIEEIISNIEKNEDRKKYNDIVAKSKYNIINTVNILQKIYSN